MTDAPSTIVHKWFQEVWNNGREDVIGELMADQAIAHGITDAINDRGPEGFRRFYQKFRTDFSDIYVATDKIMRDEDLEVAHCHVTATHAESGTPVSFSGMTMARIVDGKIIEAWNYFDFLGMYQQLGMELAPKSN
jgi:predicted SnoaL-like aldol condensation-catalyzing enzyme